MVFILDWIFNPWENVIPPIWIDKALENWRPSWHHEQHTRYFKGDTFIYRIKYKKVNAGPMPHSRNGYIWLSTCDRKRRKIFIF